jgi:hypothetical protein
VKEKTTKVLYWIAALAYAAIVAFQSEGFWIALNLVLITVTARFGFQALVTLIIMARDPGIMDELGEGTLSRVLLGTMGLTAALYVLPIPLGVTWPALAAPLVGWSGFMIVVLSTLRINQKNNALQAQKGREAQ